MRGLIVCKDGKTELIFDRRDIADLIERYGGYELRCAVEEYLDDCEEELSEYKEACEDTEKEMDRLMDHQHSLLNDIKDEAEALSELLDAERLNREKLRKAANNIYRLVYNEL